MNFNYLKLMNLIRCPSQTHFNNEQFADSFFGNWLPSIDIKSGYSARNESSVIYLFTPLRVTRPNQMESILPKIMSNVMIL
jgi:hypothetical protein